MKYIKNQNKKLNKVSKINLSLSVSLTIFLFSFSVFSNVNAYPSGSVNNSKDNYVWSENIGWINFGAPTGNVQVSDTGLTGYALSPNYGWIVLGPIGNSPGVKNLLGTLSGFAWNDSLGYIDFTGVNIDKDGVFHGFASGKVTGKISFNCQDTISCDGVDFKLKTSWKAPAISVSQNTSSNNDLAEELAFANESSATSIKRTYKKGDISTEIKTLQQFLNNNNFIVSNSGIGSLGRESTRFGDAVEAALKKFQVSKGIKPTGILDSITLSVINDIIENGVSEESISSSAPTSVSIITNQDIAVSDEEELVVEKKAVNIGNKVWKRAVAPLTKPLKVNDIDEEVVTLQKFLNNNGFPIALSGPGSKGKETDIFGIATKNALKKFQESIELEPRGNVGPGTREFINAIK